jgi:hypothetical protein
LNNFFFFFFHFSSLSLLTMVKLPSLKRIFDEQDDPPALKPARLRKLLIEIEEWECEDDEWESGIKDEVVEQWKELVVRLFPPSLSSFPLTCLPTSHRSFE